MSFRDIENVVTRYFDALHHADAGLMERVMHPAMVYATADEEQPLIRALPEYLEVLRARQSPAERGEARSDQILSIETVGERTAMAKVLCSIGERHFTDLLSLIRIDGQWQIIAKIFAIEFAGQET